MHIIDGKEHIPQVRELITEYVRTLNRDLSFQAIEDELSDPGAKYTPPMGEVILAVEGEGVLGMAAYRALSDARCEMKRLYVRPQARGLHLGDALVAEIIARARAAGYKEMVLDTLRHMEAARYLYKKHGFEECAPYYDNPMDDAIYMLKRL